MDALVLDTHATVWSLADRKCAKKKTWKPIDRTREGLVR